VRSHIASSLRGMTSGGQQVPEPGCQREPTRAPVTPTASLPRQPLAVSLELTLVPTLMGQLSKCLVVQHGLSSFPISSA
jgi:hypothetical protein